MKKDMFDAAMSKFLDTTRDFIIEYVTEDDLAYDSPTEAINKSIAVAINMLSECAYQYTNGYNNAAKDRKLKNFTVIEGDLANEFK